MTHYRRDDESNSEFAERLERCEAEAGWYFANATKPQKAACDRAMADLRGLDAPRYDRAREAAERQWKATTAAAAELCELTLAELMDRGEVSEALSYRWDQLAVSDAMMDAAE